MEHSSEFSVANGLDPRNAFFNPFSHNQYISFAETIDFKTLIIYRLLVGGYPDVTIYHKDSSVVCEFELKNI
jgi:hypothetical protein